MARGPTKPGFRDQRRRVESRTVPLVIAASSSAADTRSATCSFIGLGCACMRTCRAASRIVKVRRLSAWFRSRSGSQPGRIWSSHSAFGSASYSKGAITKAASRREHRHGGKTRAIFPHARLSRRVRVRSANRGFLTSHSVMWSRAIFASTPSTGSGSPAGSSSGLCVCDTVKSRYRWIFRSPSADSSGSGKGFSSSVRPPLSLAGSIVMPSSAETA